MDLQKPITRSFPLPAKQHQGTGRCMPGSMSRHTTLRMDQGSRLSLNLFDGSEGDRISSDRVGSARVSGIELGSR